MKPYVSLTKIKEYYDKGTNHEIVAMLLDIPTKRVFDAYARFILKDTLCRRKIDEKEFRTVMSDSMKWLRAKNSTSNFVLITHNEEVINACNKMINK